jgi:hypothetical protein
VRLKLSLLMAVGAVIDLLAAALLWRLGFFAVALFMLAVAAAVGVFAFVQWRRGE